MTCKGKTKARTRCTRQVAGRRKYCFQHSPSRKSKKKRNSRRQNPGRRNPSLRSVQKLLDKVNLEIKRLCFHFSCLPEECKDSCGSPYTKHRRKRHYRRRNPWRRFSRPLSAGLARQWMGEELYPEPQRRKTVLLIGGDQSYIPDWMATHFDTPQIHQVDVDLEQQLGDVDPDLILNFVKADKPFRPSRHTTYKVREYARGQNSKDRHVPYITVHKGWSHVIHRATELGADWFVEAYPHNIFIPREDLLPKAEKPLTAAKVAHHQKRADRFFEAGITSKDVNYAQAKYIREEPSECSLCDTKIKYQFRLLFDRPDQPEPIIFFPVGSVCITDWMDALPDSKGKLAFCVQLKSELEKVEEIKNKKKKTAAEKSKTKRRQESAARKEREKQRLAGIAARKKKTKKKKKKTIKKKTIKKKVEGKFSQTQAMMGWDEPEPEPKKPTLQELFDNFDDDSTTDDW